MPTRLKIRHGLFLAVLGIKSFTYLCLNYADLLSGVPLAQFDMQTRQHQGLFHPILNCICFFSFKRNAYPKEICPLQKNGQQRAPLRGLCSSGFTFSLPTPSTVFYKISGSQNVKGENRLGVPSPLFQIGKLTPEKRGYQSRPCQYWQQEAQDLGFPAFVHCSLTPNMWGGLFELKKKRRKRPMPLSTVDIAPNVPKKRALATMDFITL